MCVCVCTVAVIKSQEKKQSHITDLWIPNQLHILTNVRRTASSQQYLMLGRWRMTTSRACTASAGTTWLRPSSASSSAYRLAWATNFIATLNVRSRPSLGNVTSSSTCKQCAAVAACLRSNDVYCVTLCQRHHPTCTTAILGHFSC